MSGQQDLFRRFLGEKQQAAAREQRRDVAGEEGAPEEREGTVEDIRHQSDDDFRIIRVRVGASSQTWRGKMPPVAKGQPVIATGRATVHPQYGPQFLVTDLHAKIPSSTEGIRHFLLGLGVKGLGPKKIDRLVDTFREGLSAALDQPLLLTTQIGSDLAHRTTAAWQAAKVERAEVMKLQEYGATALLANRIVKHYKGVQKSAVEVVEKNPYWLALDVDGVGFTTADAIALKMGVGADSPERVKAGLLHVLHEATSKGHCYVPRRLLVEQVAEKITVDSSRVEQALGWLDEDRRVIVESVTGDPDEDAVFPVKLREAEQTVTDRVRALLTTPSATNHGPPPALDVTAEQAIGALEREAGVTLAGAQRDAVAMAARHKVMVLTGPPGVGKSFVTKAVLDTFRRAQLVVHLAAPTGRAAKRLSEATGTTAKTIHRLLEVDPVSRDFVHTAQNQLKTNAVIVDETSMAEVELMADLLEAIPDGARLVLVGDVDQLPSVGPGAVLRDLIGSGVVPTVRLTQIFRQAKGSRISTAAVEINAGKTPTPDDPATQDGEFYWFRMKDPEQMQAEIVRLVTEKIPERFGFKPEDIQVLTPMNRNALGTVALNGKVQALLNPDGAPVRIGGTELRVGDRVIVTKNNKDLDVYNGDIGRVIAVDPEDGDATVVVDIDGRHVVFPREDAGKLMLAYAISVHRSQGGGFPCVVMTLAMQHYMLLTRNLLYTGATRAKKLLVLVADPKAVRMALSTARKDDRNTGLAARLRATSYV